MGKSGKLDAVVDDLYVLLKTTLVKLLVSFDDKAGWWYPVLQKVGDENDINPSVPERMGLEEESALQSTRKTGLVIHKQPHKWQINQRAWTSFFTMQKMSLQMEINKYKVGKKHHYFLKFGGGLIHAQPFKQYSEEGFLTKTKHSV
jgi:hypothetical protein